MPSCPPAVSLTQSPCAQAIDLCPNAPTLNAKCLMAGLAQALEFPEYFGHNWDAAWDCLTDLTWAKDQHRHLQLHIDSATEVDEDALSMLIELLGDAAEHWQEHGHCLRLCIYCPEQTLDCLEDLPCQ